MNHNTSKIGTPNFNPDFSNTDGVIEYHRAIGVHNTTFHPVVQSLLEMPHQGDFPLGTTADNLTARDITRLHEEGVQVKMDRRGEPVITHTVYVGKRGTTPRKQHLRMDAAPACVKAVLTAIAQAQAAK
jgi:hypothetical protein